MKSLITLLAIFSITNAFSQKCSGWNWPEDKDMAERKYALYTDAKKRGDFRIAANEIQWILKNAPALNRSNYINGAKIYQNLAELEKDPAKKRVYQDSALLMYDLRIQYCNDKASVLNRKAFAAYQFFKDDSKEYQYLYNLFKEAFELNGNNTWDNNLVAYMYLAHKYKKAGGELSDEEVLNVYDQIVEIIEFKISQGKNVDRLVAYKDNVDKLLTSTVNVDCEFVEKNLVPKLESNPDDLKMAKKIFGLALFAKCTDYDFFVETAIRIHEKEPNYGMAWTIGNKCLAKKDFECAERYFNEAIELTEENEKEADLYYKLASIASSNGQRSKSRGYALKSVHLADNANPKIFLAIFRSSGLLSSLGTRFFSTNSQSTFTVEVSSLSTLSL